MTDITLVVISPLNGFVQPNGNIVLTAKFVDGMKLYRDLWDGPILHLCEPADRESDNLDNIEVPMAMPEFETKCGTLTDSYLRSILPRRSIVLVSVGEQFNSISRLCRELGIPCVYITEYSLKTRRQIAVENQRSTLHGLWSQARQVKQEIDQRAAIKLASAVQCNGLPTYHSYSGLNSRAHLFFDTRMDASMFATNAQVERRSFENRQGKKLRLTFSGRLNLMKGVDDLILVAEHLRVSLGDWFHLSICGDGDYAPQLRKDIDAKGLRDLVTLKGNMDFKTELVPFVTNETDIFVCCHRQGDPSCTYLETMACGAPIIGYANEAWESLSEHARAGWVTKSGDPKAMANRIADIDRDPEALENEAMKSLEFSLNHTFEQTFKRRVDHLKSIAA